MLLKHCTKTSVEADFKTLLLTVTSIQERKSFLHDNNTYVLVLNSLKVSFDSHMSSTQRSIQRHMNWARTFPSVVFVYDRGVAGDFVASCPPTNNRLHLVHLHVHLIHVAGICQLCLHLYHKIITIGPNLFLLCKA